jgi:hypothetical protein
MGVNKQTKHQLIGNLAKSSKFQKKVKISWLLSKKGFARRPAPSFIPASASNFRKYRRSSQGLSSESFKLARG